MTKAAKNLFARLGSPRNEIAPRGERNSQLLKSAAQPATLASLDAQANRTPERGLLRPGREVTVLNVTDNKAVVKSPHRLKPGSRTELQLVARRRVVSGSIDACRISRLEPLCYEAVFIFDDQVETTSRPEFACVAQTMEAGRA